ncbi:MAG: 4-hydroxy-tetrahydrodipicolinate synthase [Syntrophothermaceae bacterium]|jgi:4-hydroxy-tetrahydrodipicolinate synthase
MAVVNVLNARLLTAMVTPYDDELQVDYQKARELASYLVRTGTEGIVVCGTTGESPTLTPEEKLRLFTAVKEEVGERAEVWAGTGSNFTRATIELTQAASRTGVDGIMLVTPYYNKPSQDGLYEHFRKIAEAADLPVMLYNVPGRTGANLLPETVQRLSQVENIVAIKEASGNLDQVSQLRILLPDDFVIYSGDDSLTLPMLAVGASGVVSIVSHIAGPEIRAMMESFFAGDVVRAAELHAKLFPLFKGLFITTNPVPLKEALNMMGTRVGGFRLPLTGATDEEKLYIRQMLQQLGYLIKE